MIIYSKNRKYIADTSSGTVIERDENRINLLTGRSLWRAALAEYRTVEEAEEAMYNIFKGMVDGTNVTL